MPVLATLVALGIGAGQILASAEEALLALPLLLIIVPPINAASGMIGAVFGSRVSTGLHTGSLLSNRGRQFRRDLTATVILGLAVFTALWVLAVTAAPLLGASATGLFTKLLIVLAGTGLLVLIGMIVAVVLIGTISFRVGWDPDTVIVPVVTTIGDLLGIASFIFMVHWVGM